jgi:hypothetical protein
MNLLSFAPFVNAFQRESPSCKARNLTIFTRPPLPLPGPPVIESCNRRHQRPLLVSGIGLLQGGRWACFLASSLACLFPAASVAVNQRPNLCASFINVKCLLCPISIAYVQGGAASPQPIYWCGGVFVGKLVRYAVESEHAKKAMISGARSQQLPIILARLQKIGESLRDCCICNYLNMNATGASTFQTKPFRRCYDYQGVVASLNSRVLFFS